MAAPEKERLKRYRAGDVRALEELVEQYRRPLFGFILKMTEGHEDAEEIFQEVWFRAIRKIDHFRTGRFLSWLFRITHNLVIDRARKHRADASLQDVLDEDGRTLEDIVADGGDSPAEVTGRTDLDARIRAAVAQLPADQREVFVLRTWADMPFREIAGIQGVSISTALARMRYAMEKLRERLSVEYAELSGR
jgi:RNA polymerase sigma-70 factor (ECF subfamily)